MKKKILKIVLFLSLIIILIIALGTYLYFRKKEQDLKLKLLKEKELVEKIKSHYSSFVKTNKDTLLYDEKGNAIGKISADIILELNEINIDKDTKLFKLTDFIDTYIKYEDVIVSEKDSSEPRFLKYIPYNKNIKTNDKFDLYDKDDNIIYELKGEYNFPIIIKEDNHYGIIFNNQLLYIKNKDISNIYDSNNTNKTNTSGIPVLNYHAFYDETNSKERNSCQTSICHSKKQFKEQLDLIKERQLFTVTMDEFELYMYNKLQLPKSILLTLDDGIKEEHAIKMLDEYKMNATIFLVTIWVKPENLPKSDYIEYHSHTHNMHNTGVCPWGQGGGIRCLPKDKILEDLKLSREYTNNSRAFCYPYYEYNTYSEELVKQSGFTLAFVGEVPITNGYQLASPSVNKLRVPRFVILTTTTIKDLKDFFNQVK